MSALNSGEKLLKETETPHHTTGPLIALFLTCAALAFVATVNHLIADASDTIEKVRFLSGMGVADPNAHRSEDVGGFASPVFFK